MGRQAAYGREAGQTILRSPADAGADMNKIRPMNTMEEMNLNLLNIFILTSFK